MKKKLIEVALPLEAINVVSAREESIRHGHPSNLHLRSARQPPATSTQPTLLRKVVRQEVPR